MKFNRHKPAQSHEPERLGDILPEVVDVENKTIHQDPAAEKERKLAAKEHLAKTLRETRSELIEQRQAGEPVDTEDIAAVGEELQQTIAERENLRQQLGEQPDQP